MSYQRIQAKRDHGAIYEGGPSTKQQKIVPNQLQLQAKNFRQFFSTPLIYQRKQFIKLFCPNCGTKCVTFGEYKNHLHSDKHLKCMEKKIKVIENEIIVKRKEQAIAQAEADRAVPRQGTSHPLNYCAVCDLNYFQEESGHVASKLHIGLAALLEPRCNICSYTADDFIDYEKHLCSLVHLKKEDEWTGKQEEYNILPSEGAQKQSDKHEASTCNKDDIKVKPTSNQAKETQSTAEVTGDQEKFFVEALYCTLCNVHFSCEEGQETAIKKHCKMDRHLELWSKYVEENHKARNASQE